METRIHYTFDYTKGNEDAGWMITPYDDGTFGLHTVEGVCLQMTRGQLTTLVAKGIEELGAIL